ncbi:carboxypeptidase-like regulatory domain-containing protein [Lutibacter holmesii]|uniref:Carboxypeptidase-like regulatory domain-containing protein n=1 Tax=Lutibacter holmesii TaxID=1137985 RepID=A0ABW3WL54_9FLAO
MKPLFLAFALLFSLQFYGQSFEMTSLVKEISQNGEIKGVVLDHEFENEPLVFATVEIKDTNLSTTTDLDGSFSFNLKPGNYTLIFSFTGYKTIEIPGIHISANKTSTCNQIMSALQLQPNLVVSQMK